MGINTSGIGLSLIGACSSCCNIHEGMSVTIAAPLTVNNSDKNDLSLSYQ